MAKLKTYSEFLGEGIMDVLKSPIKYVKIKNNAKKLVKAKVAVALNDVNFEKKKQKSTIKDPDKNAVLTKANAAKNDALKDTAKGVSDRMDDLATSPILKKVSSLAKTKAAVAANKTILKSATGEEAKQLKVRQTELNKKATKLAGGIKDFESTAAKKEETKPAVQEMPQDKPKTKTTEEKPKTKESAADKKKAEKKQELGNKIGDAMKAITRAKAEGKSEEAEKAKAVEKLNSVKGTEEEGAASKAVAAFATAKKSREDAIKKLQDNIKDLQKQQKELNESVEPESFEYVEESESAEKGLKAIPAVLSWDIEQFLKKQKDAKKLIKGSFTDLVQALHSRGFEDRLNGANLRNFQAVVKKHIKESVEPESFEYVAESVSEKFARLRPNL